MYSYLEVCMSMKFFYSELNFFVKNKKEFKNKIKLMILEHYGMFIHFLIIADVNVLF